MVFIVNCLLWYYIKRYDFFLKIIWFLREWENIFDLTRSKWNKVWKKKLEEKKNRTYQQKKNERGKRANRDKCDWQDWQKQINELVWESKHKVLIHEWNCVTFVNGKPENMLYTRLCWLCFNAFNNRWSYATTIDTNSIQYSAITQNKFSFTVNDKQSTNIISFSQA